MACKCISRVICVRSKMTCLLDLGKPRPRVTWFLESQTIDAPSEIRETQGPGGETNVVTISNVTLKGLTRSHYHAKLFCKASNTHLAPPPTTAVIIELHSKWNDSLSPILVNSLSRFFLPLPFSKDPVHALRIPPIAKNVIQKIEGTNEISEDRD